jgi:glutathione S-transferase
MIDVYCFGQRPRPESIGLTRDLRVLWAVEELKLAYRPVPVDFARLSAAEAEILGPFRQLPVVVDEQVVVRESGAILLYLVEKAETASSMVDRTELTQWVMAVLSTLEPRIGRLWQERHDDIQDERAADIAHRRLRQFNDVLSERPFLLKRFSVADILLATVLKVANKLDLLGSYASLIDYSRACEARSARRSSLEAYRARLCLPRTFDV